MNYCSLEEAFTGPANPPPGKQPKKKRTKEHFVPSQLSSNPSENDEVLASSTSTKGTVPSENATSLAGLFPMPGETGDHEEWEKAFTLEPSKAPGSASATITPISVNGKATMWRDIPEPKVLKTEMTIPYSTEIHERLDKLTRQLEALSHTSITPMQSTAELFLFVAIGLMFLLALDTLFRFASSMADRKMMGGGRSGFSGFSGLRRRFR
jgi:hypothetical protein